MLKYLYFALIPFVIISCSSESQDTEESEMDTISPEVEFSIVGFPKTSTSNEPIVVSNQIEIKIDARDNGGIAKIEAFINDEKVGEDSTAPYNIIVDVSGYNSKISQTSKFKDYILRITVTDINGNETSEEQVIYIDNELPLISDVSLENTSLINGSDNIITFNVSDNEGLLKVNVHINEILYSEIFDEVFETNLNTLELADGENILKIEAVDLAENIATFEVLFLIDNAGPEINIESLIVNSIIDETIIIKPEITDNYSSIKNVTFSIDNEQQLSFENGNDYEWNFNPENFDTGDKLIKISAKDSLDNESILELPIQIFRRLVTINIPENRIDNGMKIAVAFVSRMDGTLIQSKEILRDDRQIIFNTKEEFEDNQEFMLSFYLEENPYSNTAYISTHQNLTRVNPGILNLATPKYLQDDYISEIPTSNFLSNDYIISNGGRYINGKTYNTSRTSAYYGHLNSERTKFEIATSEWSPQSPFEIFYLYMNDSGVYKYKMLDNPISEGSFLDKTSFTTENIERNYVNVPSGNFTFYDFILEIFAASTLQDDLMNNYHQIYSPNPNIFNYDQNIPYDLNTTFLKYKHTFAWDNFYTERRGVPIETYEIPSVSINYSLEGNKVYINTQFSESTLGRIYCQSTDLNPNYTWTITYDTKKLNQVIIPEIPDNIFHTVTEAQDNNTLNIFAVSLFTYENIADYNTYIQKVLKENNEILDISDWFNSFTNSSTQGPQYKFYGRNQDFPFNNY
ncbi:hypothetical protein SAMN04488008_11090 [Maribacter orientalis]|uniref:Uncharacterized protein n=1 Tax=Maribacter orientalis TaxID=228957 RepID=A0A1H7W571_9FLAO|nr:Ig-like domain-containing protein [Maribacter orientalis]SEM16148.1 hypothetical protein SAMN04488008_11090 [Maribacter orientalis]